MHTFALGILALQVQEGGAAPLGDVNVVDILRGTGPVNIIVLAILVLLSVVSWAIILRKTLSYRTIERQTATFLDVFRRSTKFSEVQSRMSGRPGPNDASTTSDSLPTKTDRSRTARDRARCSIISAL